MGTKQRKRTVSFDTWSYHLTPSIVWRQQDWNTFSLSHTARDSVQHSCPCNTVGTISVWNSFTQLHKQSRTTEYFWQCCKCAAATRELCNNVCHILSWRLIRHPSTWMTGCTWLTHMAADCFFIWLIYGTSQSHPKGFFSPYRHAIFCQDIIEDTEYSRELWKYADITSPIVRHCPYSPRLPPSFSHYLTREHVSQSAFPSTECWSVVCCSEAK